MDFERSLSYGLFPKEVPSSFSSEPFASVAASLTTRPTSPAQSLWTIPARFNLSRPGGLRRGTEIPNPLSQIRITETCSTHWRQLQRVTALSPISLSRPVKQRTGPPLEYYVELANRPSATIAKMPGGSVTLHTDLSQFYGSIYTHAIDWAVRTKRVAKRSMRGAGPGQQLDARVRESRHGQTVGISIGPDTSWLIAELILARIDSFLLSTFPQIQKRAVRFGDDMTVFASSEGEAHDVLAAYQTALAEYELKVNPTKTHVVPGITPVEPEWVVKLRQARYRDESDRNLRQDVSDLFGLALTEVRNARTQGVLSYAIKRCDPFPSGKSSWPVYRDLVVASISQEPSTLRHVHEVLVFARARGLTVDNDRLVEVFNAACRHHAAFDHGYEVSWILSTLRDLALPLDTLTAEAVSTMQDNCSLVLLLDMASRSRTIRNHVNLDPAIRRAERKGALTTEDWLLAYEARASRWCTPKAWDGISAFKEMNAKRIRFLVDAAAPAKTRLKRRRPVFLPSWYP